MGYKTQSGGRQKYRFTNWKETIFIVTEKNESAKRQQSPQLFFHEKRLSANFEDSPFLHFLTKLKNNITVYNYTI